MAAKGCEALAGNRFDEAAFVAEMMLERQGIAIRDLPTDAAKAKQGMLRAGIDLSEALKARYEGDFNYEPRDKLLKAKLAEPQPKHWPTGGGRLGPGFRHTWTRACASGRSTRHYAPASV